MLARAPPCAGEGEGGLNNLISFTAGIKLDLSAAIRRRANGRLHQIGQAKPVPNSVPYFAGTAQQTLFDLIARKLSTSLLVDGIDLQAALEAAGASEDETQATAAAIVDGAGHLCLPHGSARGVETRRPPRPKPPFSGALPAPQLPTRVSR